MRFARLCKGLKSLGRKRLDPSNPRNLCITSWAEELEIEIIGVF
jgi:hypothetical protein